MRGGGPRQLVASVAAPPRLAARRARCPAAHLLLCRKQQFFDGADRLCRGFRPCAAASATGELARGLAEQVLDRLFRHAFEEVSEGAHGLPLVL